MTTRSAVMALSMTPLQPQVEPKPTSASKTKRQRKKHKMESTKQFSAEHHTKSTTTTTTSPLATRLQGIPVSPALLAGILVARVHDNGDTQECFLSLSEDRFTIYLSTGQVHYDHHHATRMQTRNPWPWIRRFWLLQVPEWYTTAIHSLLFHTKNHHSKSLATATNTTNIALDIGDMDWIQRGSCTAPFEKITNPQYETLGSGDQDASTSIHFEPKSCFSIHFVPESSSSTSLSMKATTSNNCNTRSLNLMVLSHQLSQQELVDTLELVYKTFQEEAQFICHEILLLRRVWRLNSISEKDTPRYRKRSELGLLLKRMNYSISFHDLSRSYDWFTKRIGMDRKSKRKGLTLEQTCFYLYKLKQHDASWKNKPINIYWKELFGEIMKNGKPRETVSARSFLELFMWQCQGDIDATIDTVQELFAKWNRMELLLPLASRKQQDFNNKYPTRTSTTRIDKNRFEAYLLSRENEAFDPKLECFDSETMKRPLNEYWIKTLNHHHYYSHVFYNYYHNTLSAEQQQEQFAECLTADIYSYALYKGFRCFELNVCDGGVGTYGLPRPIVWDGYTMTSKILFKDIVQTIKLFLDIHQDSFPIILCFENRCSLLFQEVMANQLVEILGESLYIPNEDPLILTSPLPSPWDLRGKVVIIGKQSRNNVIFESYETDETISSDDGASSFFASENTVTGASSPKKVYGIVSVLLNRLTLSYGTNEVPMIRTYPATSNINSTHGMAIIPLSLGCEHLVSEDFHAKNAVQLWNDGKFRQNGNCGYVVKHESAMEMFNYRKASTRAPMFVSIRVLSGSCLPKPKERHFEKCINPYVQVSVYDIRNGDWEVTSKFQTGVVYNNGLFPIWNEGTFTFLVQNTEVAMLQLTVYDKESAITADKFVATATIPIACLRQGLRSVKLFDATNNNHSGTFEFASLLIAVKKGQGKWKPIETFSSSTKQKAHSSKTELCSHAETLKLSNILSKKKTLGSTSLPKPSRLNSLKNHTFALFSSARLRFVGQRGGSRKGRC